VRGQFTLRCGFALFGCLTLRGGGSMCCRISVLGSVAMFRGVSMLGGSCPGRSRTLCRSFAMCRSFALCGRTGCFALCCCTGSLALRGSAAIGQVAVWRLAMDVNRSEAARQALFCEHVLAKSGSNVLLETLRDAKSVAVWEHFPSGDVFDPETGAQWYYHSHPPQEGLAEHGHFHCFVRPNGAGGPVHHLAAIGVDPYGRLLRLFTVNQWVVGDEWLDAEGTIALLPRFDLHFARPSYLVNRWLAAVVSLFGDEIATLIRARDEAIAAHRPVNETPAREDRALEVTSELVIDLRQVAASLGV